MIIGNYTIKQKLGEGGMATVYLAEHNILKQPVAIKILKEEYVFNENIRKRFLSEAKNMFKMTHPNIIKVTDLIDQEDGVAFVMEYIEGETLKEYLERKGKLTDEEIKKLFVQMLEAVSYVHEQNFVHRDIKPSNFMISPKGVVKLLDFGIAKNTDKTSAEYTQTGTMQNMGTPMYMSPEQIKSTKDVTDQSDIYSLGVVLWQMVMGQKPYNTNLLSIPEIQVAILKDKLAKTKTIWDELIDKATAKELQERLVNCKEIIYLVKKIDNIGVEKIKAEETVLVSIVNNDLNKAEQSNNKRLTDGKKEQKDKKKNYTTPTLIVLILLVFSFFIYNSTEFVSNDNEDEPTLYTQTPTGDTQTPTGEIDTNAKKDLKKYLEKQEKKALLPKKRNGAVLKTPTAKVLPPKPTKRPKETLQNKNFNN
jgi:serine/threonine-protein kinase